MAQGPLGAGFVIAGADRLVLLAFGGTGIRHSRALIGFEPRLQSRGDGVQADYRASLEERNIQDARAKLLRFGSDAARYGRLWGGSNSAETTDRRHSSLRLAGDTR